MPWQHDTAAVLGEQIGDRRAYPIAVILIPRQCGKTTLVFDIALGRVLEHADYRAAYTAQTGHVTSERFSERMTELAGTPLARRIRRRRSQGTERMSNDRTGSFLKAFPPKDGALRGSAMDLVDVDEAQEIRELLGYALDQTIIPTFSTRRRRQLVLIGTAGTDESHYLARYLALARGGAEGVALIEYGAGEDEDPCDPAVWRARHPGLACGLTDESALRSALDVMGPEQFAREYLNVWSASGTRIIPAAAWKLCQRVKAAPRPGVAPVLAVDVAFDRSAAAIVAVWPDRDGVPVGEVVAYLPDAGAAAARLIELHAKHRPPLVLADSQGPVLTVVDALTRAGIEVVQPTQRDYSAACASTLDRINAGTVGHRAEQPLEAAVAGAGKRSVGDGWVWARRTSTADVCPLNAFTLALWGDQRRPASPARPSIGVG